MEVKRLGNLYGFDGGNFAGNVYEKDALAPTILNMQGGGRQPMVIDMYNESVKKDGVCGTITANGNIGSTKCGTYGVVEKNIVAMRGRNPENPSDRTVGAPTEQRLEPNSQGICNTITSVQKDNMVMETVRIKQATKEGYIDCKVGGVADLSFPDSETRRGRVQEGGEVCPTLTASESEICRIEKVGQISSDGSQCGTVVSENGLSPNLVAGTHGYANNHIFTRYRIRKLTPMECWRLMDFSDQDFHKAEAVNSNTQLYKQAGNSIVRNVLVAIFGQMLPGKEDDYKKGA